MNSAINLLLLQRDNLEISLQNFKRELQETERKVQVLGARILKTQEEIVEANDAIKKLEQ